MTLTHLILERTAVLVAIPVGIFVAAFLIALLDFFYSRIFMAKPSEVTDNPSFLQDMR